ncbi:charged multivesicular body protein [Holotrichia oblita]|uniref:Charged multivesicular body protein n=1 Tax=Holotrichia oblita TaxID=644536 RepID=A0ACB9SSP0_HOLOL|nr:charged multivesicular body protein [Holotrichia oblita]
MDVNFLPPDKLPDCWNDESRINVLFAPFRDKSVNPKDWESKLEFWKNLIYIYCTHNHEYVFTYTELSKKFRKGGRSPACLGVVIEEMYKNGDIQTLNVFLQTPSESWSGWITDSFVKKPILWSFTKIKNSIIASDTNISYVHINAVESDSLKLLDKIPLNMKNKVIELKTLAETLKFNDTQQLNILLHCLCCKRKLSMKTFQKKGNAITLVKFHSTNTAKGISDRDVDIFTLQQSEETLLNDIEKLENQITKLISDTKEYLAKGQRQSAKSYLRKKKDVEKVLEKRANTLHNIQTLLARVEDAHSDSEILDSYKIALTRLRTTFNETGLTEESVSKTMLELEEVLEIHDEIQASLAQQDTTVDSELEKELAELLESDDTKETGIKPNTDTDLDDIEKKMALLNIPTLPSPPKNDLSKAKISL